MDKEFTLSYLQGNHFFRSGLYFILSLVSLVACIPSLGQFRYAFLFFLFFIPILIIEFVIYTLHVKEIKKDNTIVGTMKVGRMSTIIMKDKAVGIQFEGIIENKVYILKLYSMDMKHENVLNNLSRYQTLTLEYYPKNKMVKKFQTNIGE